MRLKYTFKINNNKKNYKEKIIHVYTCYKISRIFFSYISLFCVFIPLFILFIFIEMRLTNQWNKKIIYTFRLSYTAIANVNWVVIKPHLTSFQVNRHFCNSLYSEKDNCMIRKNILPDILLTYCSIQDFQSWQTSCLHDYEIRQLTSNTM